MMSVIRRRAAGLALATTLLVAAACGDDGDDAAAPADRVSAADNPPDAVEVDEAALQALLEEWRTDVDAYGATLSIRVPGHDDVHLASGVDDRDPDTPMTTDGTYGIGTITRTFVAAAALSLVDAGKLSLDEPVEPWLPELPDADETTLAMLLGFTSGLAQLDDATEQELILADLTRQFTPDEVLALHVEQPPAAPPGDEFAYNTDTGYVAAGLLVERELDQDLATVIEERFAQPLGLDEAYVSSGAPKPTRHQWFSLDGEPDRPLDTLDFPGEATSTLNWASRNMVSSSEDLLAWAEALYTGEVLGEDTTTAMLEMRNSISAAWHYGLGAGGYCLDPTGCDSADDDLVGHTGGFVGLDMNVVHHPDSGTTLVVYANVMLDEQAYVRQLVDLDAAVLDQLGIT
jgi:D-alanyl-D-alanine carboxypeptidase